MLFSYHTGHERIRPLGLHMNLTEGLPISPICNVQTLAPAGFFRGKQGFLLALNEGEISMGEVCIFKSILLVSV